jgi:hypothetical protein
MGAASNRARAEARLVVLPPDVASGEELATVALVLDLLACWDSLSLSEGEIALPAKNAAATVRPQRDAVAMSLEFMV